MRILILLVLICINIQIFTFANQDFEQNKRILRELADSQDTCLYVVFDAGSSSTRIRLYSTQCRRSSQIPQIKPLVPKNQDNSAIYADKIEWQNSGNKITQLSKVPLDQGSFDAYFQVGFAVINQMKQYYGYTQKPFLFLRATAGVRQLDYTLQQQIMGFTRTTFRKQSDVYFFDDTWARVISGEEEGLFIWLAINYIFGKIKHQNSEQFKIENSISAMDIGGVSAQTALLTTSNNNKFLDLSEKVRVSIYANSVMNFGSDAIASRILQGSDSASCFQQADFTHSVKDTSGQSYSVTGNYDFVKCTNQLLTAMDLTGCVYANDGQVKDCSSQSKFVKLTDQQRIVGVSSIFYAKDNISKKFNLNQNTIKLSEFRNYAKQYCSNKIPSTDQNVKYISTNCIQMMWVTTYLIDGLGLLDKTIETYSEYNSYQLDWTVGSLIQDINSLQCDYIDTTQCTQVQNADQPSSSLIINSYYSIILLLLFKLFI